MKNDTTKPSLREADRVSATDRARAQALDVPSDTDPPQPDSERKRLRDAAAKTAEGLDDSKLIEVDANRVEFFVLDEGSGTLAAKVQDPRTTDEVPQDLIKVDPTKVRFSSMDPSNGPAPAVVQAVVVDSLGIPVLERTPPEAQAPPKKV